MQAFLCTDRPRSVNAKRTDFFKTQIQQAFARYCSTDEMIDKPLYGVVYYFHRKPNDLDADNLSKPIWGALETVVYKDDRIIQLRHAGIIDLRKTDLTLFDLTNVSDQIADDMIAFAGEKDHILYVEFGLLQLEMFTFAHDA